MSLRISWFWNRGEQSLLIMSGDEGSMIIDDEDDIDDKHKIAKDTKKDVSIALPTTSAKAATAAPSHDKDDSNVPW